MQINISMVSNTMRSSTVALLGLFICLAQCKSVANKVVEHRGVVPGAYKRICYPGYIWVEWRKKCMRNSRGIVPGDYKAVCRPGYIWVEWRKKCMRTSRGAEQNREVAATRACRDKYVCKEWKKQCVTVPGSTSGCKDKYICQKWEKECVSDRQDGDCKPGYMWISSKNLCIPMRAPMRESKCPPTILRC